jgi:hypothetical protein
MAWSPPPARKEECIAAIRKQLRDRGDGTLDLPALYKEFPEISKTAVYKWAHREKDGIPSERELTKAAQEIESRIESGVADHLPSLPPPGAIAKDESKLRRLDFAEEIPKLYADAEMLRAFSIKDVDGEEKIKNPVAFEKSIKARASLIETSLKVLQEVWDMRAMQQFNELIIDEIGRESPECQRRILERLALLNRRHGINFHGVRI